jgi:hypothetical protein
MPSGRTSSSQYGCGPFRVGRSERLRTSSQIDSGDR